MSRFIDISPRAWKDLRRIVRWLHSRSPRGAEAWYRAFWDEALRISADAERYPVAGESPLLKRSVRDALFKTRRGRRNRIVFDLSDTEVFILRVRQPGQRPLRSRDLSEP